MKKRAKQFYFTQNDDALWDAIQALPKGEANHEIRRALRHWFLGADVGGPQRVSVEDTDRRRAVDAVEIPSGMMM